MHTLIHTYIQTYIHTYKHTYVSTYIHTYTHIHIHMYIHTYVPTYIHTYTHTCGIKSFPQLELFTYSERNVPDISDCIVANTWQLAILFCWIAYRSLNCSTVLWQTLLRPDSIQSPFRETEREREREGEKTADTVVRNLCSVIVPCKQGVGV